MSQNPFAERTADNPTGALRREAVVRVVARDAMAPDVVVDAPATIEIALSSEAPVERFDWMTGERYVEVLDHSAKGIDLSYAKDGLPFCMDHDLDEQIGLVEELSIDGDRVLRGVVRRGNHPDAAWLFADMAAGIRKKVSIGYWPGDVYTQTKDKNGVVTRRYTGWTLYECSSVTVPADYAVGVGRNAQGAALTSQAGEPADSTKETTMSVDTTSERGAAPAPDTRAADLSAVALDFPEYARLAEWIREGISVDAAKTEVMRKMRQATAERQPTSPVTPAQLIDVGKDRAEDKPFNTFGEYLREVRTAEVSPADVTPRLRALRAGTGLQEGVGSEGGFLIPPQYAQGLITRAFQGGNILSRVRKVQVQSNRYAVNVVDETSRVAGSRWGGITSSWLGEGSSPTASRPTFRQQYFDSKKVAVLGYVTEEQLEDYAATAQIIEQGFAEELTFELERTIMEGTGSGQPLGILNSTALVTQAAEGGQTATTVNINNVSKMYARLWSRSMGNAVWLINQDVLPQIATMTLGNFPIYLAPGQASNGSSFGLLFGRPVVVTEYNGTLGAVGDIVLADLDQYLVAERVAPSMQSSMHVRFVQGEQAFRMIYRVDGAPLWNAALTPLKGSNTQSPFIALAAR